MKEVMFYHQSIFVRLITLKITNEFRSRTFVEGIDGDTDSFADCGSLSRILYLYEIAAVLSLLHSPGGSTVNGGGFRSLIASIVFTCSHALK